MDKLEVIARLLDETPAPSGSTAWDRWVGRQVLVRTVTMIQVGTLTEVHEHEIVLTDAAWVADTGRWADCLVSGTLVEVEPWPAGEVIVGRGALVDACLWAHGPVREQK